MEGNEGPLRPEYHPCPFGTGAENPNHFMIQPERSYIMKKIIIAVLAAVLILSFHQPVQPVTAAGCSKTVFSITLKEKAKLKAEKDTDSKTVKTLAKGKKLSVIKRSGSWYKVCYSNKAAYIKAVHTKEVFTKTENAMLKKASKQKKSKQVLAAISSKASSTSVRINAYEYKYGEWRRALEEMSGVIGYRGMASAKNKKEGDGRTPMGIYSFGTAFGTAKKPAGMDFPFKKAGKYDYWVDDVNSKDYNKWKTYKGNPKKKWASFERMNISLYKYGAVINYNTKPIVKGKGSAIFLHIWRGKGTTTAGCTATSEKNVIRILKWLDPDMNPHMISATKAHLNKSAI